jgi:hypothetical protein
MRLVPEQAAAALELWRTRQFDTSQIAAQLFAPEAAVANTIAAAIERQRARVIVPEAPPIVPKTPPTVPKKVRMVSVPPELPRPRRGVLSSELTPPRPVQQPGDKTKGDLRRMLTEAVRNTK